jgi:hypothetical protein
MPQRAYWGGQATILRRLALRDRKTGVALRHVPIRSPFHTAWAFWRRVFIPVLPLGMGLKTFSSFRATY